MTIKAGDRLTQRVDPVRERQQRVQHTEEGRHHFDRIQAGSTRNLYDHDDDAQALADVLEAGRQHVDDRHKHHRDEHGRTDES